MNKLNRMLALSALLLSGYAGSATADRLLLEEGATRVTLIGAHACGQPVYLNVEADDPDLFMADFAQLQRVIDAASAALSFECEKIPEIRIEGRLKGLDGEMFRGVAKRDADWRVTATGSILGQAQEGQVNQQAAASADSPATGGTRKEYAVVDLTLGMQVADARESITRKFASAPRYDIAKGRMALEVGGCPEGYDWTRQIISPQVGWKCLTGQFTDQRDARLYRLELVQVINGTDLAPVLDALKERFGQPVGQWSEPAGFDQRTEVQRMAWGREVDHSKTGNRPVHELEAEVYAKGGVLITAITLYDPALQPGWSVPAPSGGSGLQL